MSESSDTSTPLAHLHPEEKAKRSSSFGAVADHYERFRPGPGGEAVDWVLDGRTGLAVDLGAGTGALTRLLVDRVDEVVAVEPDDRMRSVLSTQVPAARAVEGRGEDIPLPDACAQAVMASSSWHWMDPDLTLREVARVLEPGGVLGALWTGPNPEGPLMEQGRAMLAQSNVTTTLAADMGRPVSTLEIPSDAPFDVVEHAIFTWNVALTADEIIGLLGTMSWIITMGEDARTRLLDEARRLLREVMGVEGAATIDVEYCSDSWRAVCRPS
jgi:SAM-dependent methyltransferase